VNHFGVGLILLTAAFIHGVAGFAFALFAVPLLIFFWPLREVVPLIALLGGTINGLLLLSLRRHFHWRRIFSLLVGSIPGVLVGAVFLTKAPERELRIMLAALLVGYGLWGLLNPSPRVKLGDRWGYFFGFLAGALGAALNTPGPPVVIYVTLKGWTKDEVKGALQGYFFLLAALIIGAHAFHGLITWEVFKRYLFCVPLVVGGLFLGHRFYYRLSLKVYLRVLYGILILAGFLAWP